jgi:hypothetical protein
LLCVVSLNDERVFFGKIFARNLKKPQFVVTKIHKAKQQRKKSIQKDVGFSISLCRLQKIGGVN